MQVWSVVALILVLTVVAVALGLNTFAVASLSLIGSYVWFISSAGGFKTSESFAMAAGFGLMFMMPTAVGIGVAVLLGRLLLAFFSSKRSSPVQHLLKELGPPPVVASIDEAVDLAAAQLRIGSRIRVSCPSCHKPLVARRILSSTGATPDIEANCPCGACLAIRPFSHRAV
jgi:cation transport ATPase